MVSKKGGILIASVVTIFSFIAVAWQSCTKPGDNLNTCNNVICLNGGYCHKDTLTKTIECLCPTGYEGANCGTVSVSKFVGTWDIMQVITGSDSVVFNHDTSYYQVALKKTATPTTFFIYNFANNLYYNNIICTLDSQDSHSFYIDTISAYGLMYDHYHILSGFGTISADNSQIIANMITRHLGATSNWINDTFYFSMRLH